jgi:hypothetical protein
MPSKDPADRGAPDADEVGGFLVRETLRLDRADDRVAHTYRDLHPQYRSRTADHLK